MGEALLGFLDGPMVSSTAQYWSNKVGGCPDWAGAPPSSHPQCTLCSQPLIQVCQIYAPLSSSPYHRTLHLLACPQPPCWSQAGSWSCLRSQVKEEVQGGGVEVQAPSTKATDWLGDADDWGEEEWGGGEDSNGNPGTSTPSSTSTISTPSTPSPLGATGGFPISTQNLNIAQQTPSLALLSLGPSDGNANSRREGREGASEGQRPTAQVEAGDEGPVAMEDLAKVETDIPSLFYRSNRPLVSSVVVRPLYLWVGEEGGGQEAGAREQGLLQEYRAKEAVAEVEGKARGSAGGEAWEKVVPSHGDEMLHTMLTVIQANPGQVLRYTRGTGLPPLLLQPLQKTPQKCRHCQGPVVLELQLLPSLVSQLSSEGVEGSPVEFGTVLLYSCSSSCWEEGGEPREEVLLVQGENM